MMKLLRDCGFIEAADDIVSLLLQESKRDGDYFVRRRARFSPADDGTY